MSPRASSGDKRIDAIIAGVVGRFEDAFPGRVRGYYLCGSYADDSAVAISDIDLAILFAGTLEEDERAAAGRVAEECGRLSPVRLDLWILAEATLAGETVPLKLGSRFVYGEDVRERLTLPALQGYTRTVMDGGQFFLRQILRGAERLALPIDYPDPAGEFFGYGAVRVPQWYPPGTTHGIKELVTSVARAATGLVALRAGRYVSTKHASVAAYRQHIGDEWAEYLDALYADGKARWGYKVPDAPVDRARLRDLCSRTLAFEGYFLAAYHDHLLGRLRSADAAIRRLAVEQARHIAYTEWEYDDALAAAVAELERADT